MRPSDEPLIRAEQIQARVQELAAVLSRDYAGKDPLFIGVLKGAVHFTSDLTRAMTIPLEIDFVWARSYVGMESSGHVDIERRTDVDVAGRHVVLVEDILDTGRTAVRLAETLREQEPASLEICTLLDKPSRRVEAIHARYVGFEIEDRFVIGYGLDFDQNYRELDAVYVMEP